MTLGWRAVLAGAYKAGLPPRGEMLDHIVDIETGFPLCGRVKPHHIADELAPLAGRACHRCLEREAILESKAARAKLKALRAARSGKLADGGDPLAGGAGLGGAQAADGAASLPLDEVDGALSGRVTDQHADGVLLELPRDGAGSTPGTLEEDFAGGGTRLEKVDDHRGLSNALPEAASLHVRGGLKKDRSDLLDAPLEPFGVSGDTAPGGPFSGYASADEQASGANRPKGSKAARAAHGSSVSDPREALQERRGRNSMKRWLYVDMSQDPIVIETCWLGAFAAKHLDGHFAQGADGRWRARIAAVDFDESLLVALFMRVARAMAAEWAE